MELELLALAKANAALGATQSMDAADDICIESRAAFVEFIDECTWSHKINPEAKDRLRELLEQSLSLLAEFHERLDGQEREYVADYIKAVAKRVVDVDEFALGIREYVTIFDEPKSDNKHYLIGGDIAKQLHDCS